jgi:hypothetical protein
MVRPVGQQAPVCVHVLRLFSMLKSRDQENVNDWNAPRYEAVVAPNQDRLDMPVLDSLRRLAERYFNNPESLVNAIHFKYGPSGRLQVVVVLEIADIL